MLFYFPFLLISLTCSFASYDPEKYCHADPRFINNSREGFRLIQIQLLTRHGDRTPLHPLPKKLQNVVWNCSAVDDDEVSSLESTITLNKRYVEGREALRGNCMLGQLTVVGESQHRRLGQRFRETYVDSLNFLSANLNKSEIYLRSTDTERTIRSALNFLTGLYPTADESMDINVVESVKDNAFPNRKYCPLLGKMLSHLKKNEKYRQYYDLKLKHLEKQYSETWGFPVDLFHLNDVLRARFCHGQPFPPDMTTKDAESIMKHISMMYLFLDFPSEIKSLALGSFFQDWLKNFQSEKKFVLYSNHDSTLRIILSAFGLLDARAWPPYASHIVLELWENETKEKFVVFQYDGKNEKLAPQFCEGETFCPFSGFVQLLNSFKNDKC